MPESDMHQAYMRSLMKVIGGVPPAGEKGRWLEDIADATAKVDEDGRGVGIRSLQAAYSGQWISKNKYCSDRTLRLLERAKEHAKRSHNLAEFTELQISIWEESPELFAGSIALAREFVARLRRYDQERSRTAIPAHDGDPGIASEAAGLRAAE